MWAWSPQILDKNRPKLKWNSVERKKAKGGNVWHTALGIPASPKATESCQDQHCKSRHLVVNITPFLAIVSSVRSTSASLKPIPSQKSRMENLHQLLFFISTSTAKYKALAWPPTWHLLHSRETKKKSQFIGTKWDRFESYKLTQKLHHKTQHGKKKSVSQVRVESLFWRVENDEKTVQLQLFVQQKEKSTRWKGSKGLWPLWILSSHLSLPLFISCNSALWSVCAHKERRFGI